MRLSLLSRRVPSLKLLIVVLLIANLFVGGAQIALGDGDTEGGNPPPFTNFGTHLGCADVQNGAVRVFRDRHASFGTNAPSEACTPNEYAILIYFGHN